METEAPRGEVTGTRTDGFTMTEFTIKPKSPNPYLDEQH
jgi:hypothetical protein